MVAAGGVILSCSWCDNGEFLSGHGIVKQKREKGRSVWPGKKNVVKGICFLYTKHLKRYSFEINSISWSTG